MARRSVSLPALLERAVRLFQADLLTRLDRDVSFTQALNAALAAAFAVPELDRRVHLGRWRELVADGNGEDDGTLGDAAGVVFEAMARLGPEAVVASQPTNAESYERSEDPAVRVVEPPRERAGDRAYHEAYGTGVQAPVASEREPRTGVPPRSAERPAVGPTIDLDASAWGIRADTARLDERETPTSKAEPALPEFTPLEDEPPTVATGEVVEPAMVADGGGDAFGPVAPPAASEPRRPEPPWPKRAEATPAGPERTVASERRDPAATHPRVMTTADLERLRRAILGGDPHAMDEPVSKEPPAPRREQPASGATPGERSPGQARGSGAVEESRGREQTVNPDYPGIDPSQWEKVEDTKKKAVPKALTYEELSKALEDAAAAWEQERKEKGRQKDDGKGGSR